MTDIHTPNHALTSPVAPPRKRPRRRHLDAGDLVERHRVIDFGRHRPGAVLQQVDAARVERLLVHPHDVGGKPAPDLQGLSRERVSAAPDASINDFFETLDWVVKEGYATTPARGVYVLAAGTR